MAEMVNASGSSERQKKTRGRPRKSDAAGNLVVPQGSAVASPPLMSAVASLLLMSAVSSMPLISAVALPPVMSAVSSMPVMSLVALPPLMSVVASMPVISAVVSETPPAFTLSHSAENSANRTQGRGPGRGRPQGSGNWQMLASQGEADATAEDFEPLMIDVYACEDVIGKIMSLVQNSPKGICILCATGTVSSAAISHPNSSGGVLVYKGQFEILTLNGSVTISESGGVRIRKGGFSVSLADPNGHVIGGEVAGPLVAYRPIQAVVGKFIPKA